MIWRLSLQEDIAIGRNVSLFIGVIQDLIPQACIKILSKNFAPQILRLAKKLPDKQVCSASMPMKIGSVHINLPFSVVLRQKELIYGIR